MLLPRVIHTAARELATNTSSSYRPQHTTGYAMALEPFLETRLDTDALHFIQELFRLSEAFRQRSPLRIDHVWVRVDGVRFPWDVFRDDEPEIDELTRADLEQLTSAGDSTWTLLFNTYQHQGRWKALYEVNLKVIGGSHPLLVRHLSCARELHQLLVDVLERCGSYWDAQVVSLQSHTDFWDRFFERVDVRPHPWLDALKQRRFGAADARFAPSSTQDRAERPETSPADAPTVAWSSAPTPQDTARIEPMSEQEPQTAPQEERGKNRSSPPRIYSATEEKLALVRRLLDEKRQGRHRRKSWSWALSKAVTELNPTPLDAKTAQKHLAAERAEWDALTKAASDKGT